GGEDGDAGARAAQIQPPASRSRTVTGSLPRARNECGLSSRTLTVRLEFGLSPWLDVQTLVWHNRVVGPRTLDAERHSALPPSVRPRADASKRPTRGVVLRRGAPR